MKEILRRSEQCVKCPWRKGTDPNQIPGQYSRKKHRALERTIAQGLNQGPLRAMACHESEAGDEDFCVGWLSHQLGPGNNIALRLRMLKYNLSTIKLRGEQHGTFEETLPE